MMVEFQNFKVSSIIIKLIKTKGHHFPLQINTDHRRFLPYGTQFITIFDVILYHYKKCKTKEQRQIKLDLYFAKQKDLYELLVIISNFSYMFLCPCIFFAVIP